MNLYEIIGGYCLSTVVFLALMLFIPTLRSMQHRYLSVANLMAGILGFLLLIMLIVSLSEPNIDDQFYRYRLYFGLQSLVLPVLGAALTFVARLRRSVIFTVLLVIDYMAYIHGNWFYIKFTDIFRDYLPSSWTYYRPYDYPSLLLAAVGYFAVCYFIVTKGKLTYKS